MIGGDALQSTIGMQEAIDLLERTIAHEEAGRTSVSPKFITEAGDLIAAAKAGALPESRQATLGQILTGSRSLPQEGLIIFKSVGMAL